MKTRDVVWGRGEWRKEKTERSYGEGGCKGEEEEQR